MCTVMALTYNCWFIGSLTVLSGIKIEMRRISTTVFYNPPYKLEPGRVDKEHLDLLIDISPIRSDKVIIALSEYYINGIERRIICEKHGVNPGYFSLKIREVQDLNYRIYKLLPFYIDKMTSRLPD